MENVYRTGPHVIASSVTILLGSTTESYEELFCKNIRSLTS
jgi:hypothetical protein